MSETVLAKRKSPIQEIELSRLEDGRIALYLDGAVQFVSGPDDQVYHHALATVPALMLEGRPASVVIMGGGDGLAARNLLAFPNIRRILMVEIDRGIVDFSATNPVMREINRDSFRSPRVKVLFQDARKFVAEPPRERFDAAILDFPDPLGPELEVLFSPSFYTDVVKHVNDRGIVSAQASTSRSDVEDMVRFGLQAATMTRPLALRFKGYRMMDGVVVIAGKGLVPRYAVLPKDLTSARRHLEWMERPSANVF